MQSAAVPAASTQPHSTLSTYPRDVVDTIVDSPCATAAGNRNNTVEGDSVAANTSGASSNDAVSTDNGSDVEEESKLVIKIDTSPVKDTTGGPSRIGTPLSKAGLSKL